MKYEYELVTGEGVDLVGKCAHIVQRGKRAGEWCGAKPVQSGHPHYCLRHQPRWFYLPETDIEVFDSTGKPTGCLHVVQRGKKRGQWCGATPEKKEGYSPHVFCSHHVTPKKHLLINPELGALLPIETQFKILTMEKVFTGPFMDYLECAGYNPSRYYDSDDEAAIRPLEVEDEEPDWPF